MEDFCRKKRIGELAAVQVGVPWNLFVRFENNRWRYCLNAEFEPLSEEKIPVLVRFVNVERDKSRYFVVECRRLVRARYQELVADTQPLLLDREEEGNLVQLQFLRGMSEGNLPHLAGEEYQLC